MSPEEKSQPKEPDKDKVEPVVLLLFIGMVFFTLMLFISERFFMQDGQMFQVIAGLLTGFSGAFFMRVKPKQNEQGNGNGTNPPKE